MLNGCFPEKKLFLFDTFVGFFKEEQDYDKNELGLKYERDFTDTSVEEVMARMLNPQSCVVKRVYSPKSRRTSTTKSFVLCR